MFLESNWNKEFIYSYYLFGYQVVNGGVVCNAGGQGQTCHFKIMEKDAKGCHSVHVAMQQAIKKKSAANQRDCIKDGSFDTFWC